MHRFNKLFSETIAKPHLEFIGNQKGFDGEVLFSLWNVIAPEHPAHGSTIPLSPEPSEQEIEETLAKKLRETADAR